MQAINIEIKAHCRHPQKIRRLLSRHNAHYIGEDHQIDTYYRVPQGRLKLRQGNIENALIFYARPDQQGPKTSHIKLYRTSYGADLDELLATALKVLVVVDKRRHIYFIDNVKFHIDQVEELGCFVEIEAIDEKGVFSKDRLQQQCDFYMDLFNIKTEDLVAESYSDMLLSQKQ